MSYISLLLKTKLLCTVMRTSYDGTNEYGEQIIKQVTVYKDLPARKQTMREEHINTAEIPTDTASIKWLLFLPLRYNGVEIRILPTDILVFNRMPTDVDYFRVIHVEDATSEQHHLECIIHEHFQK